MKVVDLVTRKSDQLSLHFSDFSTNLYRIYKFTALEKKKEKESLFAQRPLNFYFLFNLGPWPVWETEEAAGGANPAPAVAGGEGEQGEEQEDVERDL